MSIAQLFNVTTDYLLTGADSNIDCEEAVEGADDIETEPENATVSEVKKNTRLNICVAIVGIMLIFIATVFCVLLFKNAWNKDEANRVNAQVEQVYDQYTKADVFFFDENNKQVQRTVWLDDTGIRAGDFVLCYTNQTQDVILADYMHETLIIPGLITLVLTLLFTLLCLEIKKSKE